MHDGEKAKSMRRRSSLLWHFGEAPHRYRSDIGFE
jgi:hypothetical protein